MSPEHDQSREMDELINDWLEGELSEADGERLRQWMDEHPENRQRFLDLVHCDTLVLGELSGAGDLDLGRLDEQGDGLRNRSGRRWLVVAAAACVLLGLSWWMFRGGEGDSVPPLAMVTAPFTTESGWRVAPSSSARMRMLAENRLHLEEGELFIESVVGHPATDRFTVETPAGRAVAEGTRFFIGSHREGTASTRSTSTEDRNHTEAMKQNKQTSNLRTRVLVLAGSVILSNSMGSVAAKKGELATAHPEEIPVKELVKANSAFGFDLYRELVKEGESENLFFSPYSVSASLAMALEGARGVTAEELGKVLHFPAAARHLGEEAEFLPWNTALLHTGMAEVGGRLNGKTDDKKDAVLMEKMEALKAKESAIWKRYQAFRADKENYTREGAQKFLDEVNALDREIRLLRREYSPYEIRMANAIWCEKNVPFRPEYLAALEQGHGVHAFGADFQKDAEKERARINHWVAEQTNGRIKELFSPGSLNRETVAILTNAIFFKGAWKRPFPGDATKPQDFILMSGKKVKTPFMRHHEKTFRYAELDAGGRPHREGPNPEGMKLIQLPYKGDELSMVVLLPNQADGLPKLEAALTSESLASWIRSTRPEKVNLDFPKFKMETAAGLRDTLGRMGVKQAFEPGGFTGMSDGPGAENIFLYDVVHKAFVEVTERGTEAAAATGMSFAQKSADPNKPPVYTFRADHPFAFVIRDDRTGTILFMGRLMQPVSD